MDFGHVLFIRKLKSATCWTSAPKLSLHSISSWSSSLLTHYSKQHLYLKVQAKSVPFLNSTCCVPVLMKATCHPGKCRAICSIFFLSKDNTCSPRSPPGIVPSRKQAPIVEHCAVVIWTTVMASVTLCSVDFQFSQVIFCFWTAFICRAFSKHQTQTFSKFQSGSPPLLWLQWHHFPSTHCL